MADTHETIADIIAEMRRIGLPRYDYTAGDMEADRRHFADRIEAACKREIYEAERRANHAAIKNVSETLAKVGPLYDAESIGNAAKLREALKHIKDRLPHMLQYMRVHWEDASAGGYFDELMLVIDAALAAPPRNCDVGVPEERIQRWSKFCKARSKKLPPIHGFEWEDYPYESEVKEGGNDADE